jgi:ABC-2 type transport system ATP-binding protein
MLSLQAEQLRVLRGGKEVLSDVSFGVAPGEVYALLGGNGAGKSTTLATFLGFLSPASGRVLVKGVPVQDDVLAARRAIASCATDPRDGVAEDRAHLQYLLDVCAHFQALS